MELHLHSLEIMAFVVKFLKNLQKKNSVNFGTKFCAEFFSITKEKGEKRENLLFSALSKIGNPVGKFSKEKLSFLENNFCTGILSRYL